MFSKIQKIFIASLLLVVAIPAIGFAANPISKDGYFKKYKLCGKVKVVNSFPDVKVKIVKSFPDLKVQVVKSFPDKIGKWQFVDSFPDFTVQFVDSFPDFTIQYVDSFPGVSN